jgi:glycosyltransferase involved in cell wall biosynthesis
LEQVRNQLCLPPHFLLYVGTIEPRKNLVRLLEAFAELWHGKAIPHHLVMAGQRGWKDEAVFAAIERLDVREAVRYLGYVPQEQLIPLYNLADAFVFPSLYEGFGLPVVEAMACGLPVITANGSALVEVAGEAAELVDPHAVGSIADGLYRVLTQPERRAELRHCGLARAAAFSWTASARQTAEVYRQI